MTGRSSDLIGDDLVRVLRQQRGILFAEPAIVWRGTYRGRGILAHGDDLASDLLDQRGYARVEWWVMSMTPAENPLPVSGEGITSILIGEDYHRLDRVAAAASELLFGVYSRRWPLIKVLDIGGTPVVPDFRQTSEVPPIPPHVHAGTIRDGKACPPGKLEAYFFPPISLPTCTLSEERVHTRLGIQPGVSKRDFLEALLSFGTSDRMYSLLEEYRVNAYEGWTIRPGVVHAPGPWPTIEMQTPQDDFNLAAWQLGQRLPEATRASEFQNWVLRGLLSPRDFLEQLVDWELSAAADFKERFFRPAIILDEGSWGRRLRIFFDEFYGEAIELCRRASWKRPLTDEPFAGLVWSGSGFINGVPIGANTPRSREFLATPQANLALEGGVRDPLVIFTFHPLRG